jgi:membrane protein
MSAAMTFYTILSLAPMLMIAVAIAGYYYDGPQVQQEIVQQVEQLTDQRTGKVFAGLLKNATQPSSGLVAGTVSLLISLLGASGVFSQLYDTFNDIWDVPSEERSGWWFMVQKRLIGIGVVVFVGVTLLGTLALSSTVAYLESVWSADYPGLVQWLKLADSGLVYLLMPVIFSVMFWFFPAAPVKWRDVWVAGVLTAFMVAGSRYLVAAYLKFSSTSEVYGAAGSVVVLLIWVYIIGLCLFLGASFSHAYATNLGSNSEPPQALNNEPKTVKPKTVEVIRRTQ